VVPITLRPPEITYRYACYWSVSTKALAQGSNRLGLGTSSDVSIKDRSSDEQERSFNYLFTLGRREKDLSLKS
jgi:hypothetical protein